MNHRLGIDFDNTLVCYDQAFYRAALDRGLIEPELAPVKNVIRDTLRKQGREADWTELQGFVYGPGIQEAELFPGVRESLDELREAGWDLMIVSHKTRYPYKGPQYDLHQHARDWLVQKQLCGGADALFDSNSVHLEPAREAKVNRIATLACEAFIDDLPEVLGHEAFPKSTRPILFDPNAIQDPSPWEVMTQWTHARGLILCA